MKRILPLILCLLLVVPVLAYAVPDDTMVYVSEYGEKYHRENCSYISSSETKSMTIKVAEKMGYEACSRCDPDQKTGVYISDEKETEEKSSYSKNSGEKSIQEENKTDKKSSIQKILEITVISFVIGFCLYFFIPVIFVFLLDAIERVKSKQK